ncbi:hypothetical protein SAMN05428947_11593 [Mucilaginibacter sp. OK283]|jgi:hypothetical protein|nr:hypothetical protein SAMN05428947_11593 [Mucilaginibacter sp. OK283]
MKTKSFKINCTTLFVYKATRNTHPSTETDPTTSMVTFTKTGGFNKPRLQ